MIRLVPISGLEEKRSARAVDEYNGMGRAQLSRMEIGSIRKRRLLWREGNEQLRR
jgi:hypothetical protein